MKASGKGQRTVIDKVGITEDTLTGRAGLSLFVKYLAGIGVYSELEFFFGSLRRNRKGQPIREIFKQLFCFFMDGSSRHLTHFDALVQDEGYAAGIESAPSSMLSSHAVKRFFRSFSHVRVWLFRRLLQRLFIWRLCLEAPEVVMLGLDTMVMDNDDAKVRHGVRPTYKKKRGFQPLQLTLENLIVDAVFRRGDAHSNNGDTVKHMIRHAVSRIRRRYRAEVPIVVRMDSGFFDQKLFEVFEKLGVGYICGGKLYEPVREYVGGVDPEAWGRHENGRQTWRFLEFAYKCGTWRRFRRALYCSPLYEDRQMLLEFERPDTVVFTNLGMGGTIDRQLSEAGRTDLLEPKSIVANYHERGADELVHRAFKDFGFEQMPFKQFFPNVAFYYVMAAAFFLFEAFMRDVCAPEIGATAYASTVRRRLIDVAAKVVSTGGQIILKITRATCERLNFMELWKRSLAPPPIVPG
jgi:hypothetical protein